MKRRVIQIADSTQLISLPRKWAVSHGVKKGDELDIKEEGNKIVVSCEKDLETKPIEINPPNYENISERIITSYYRHGTKEIILNYEVKDQNNYLDFISVKMHDQTIGYEIVKQDKGKLFIMDMSGSGSAEGGFSAGLKRCFLLLQSMSKELVEAMEKKDVNTAKSMYNKDRSINKFTNYCCRELLLRGQMDLRQTASYYHFLRDFESLADQFSLMGVYFANSPSTIPKEHIHALRSIDKFINQYLEIFLKFDKPALNELFVDMKRLDLQKLYSVKNADVKIVCYIDKIYGRIKELIDSLIDIHIC